MTILNRKRWVGLLILAAVALVVATGVVDGVKWAFASLGMIVLIGMTGICIYTLAKVLRHSDTSPKVDRLECDNTSAASFDGDDLKHVTYNKPIEAGPISKQDKKIVMEHVDELFKITREQGQENPAEAGRISKQDKKIIMAHVDELFAKGLGQSEVQPS